MLLQSYYLTLLAVPKTRHGRVDGIPLIPAEMACRVKHSRAGCLTELCAVTRNYAHSTAYHSLRPDLPLQLSLGWDSF